MRPSRNFAILLQLPALILVTALVIAPSLFLIRYSLGGAIPFEFTVHGLTDENFKNLSTYGGDLTSSMLIGVLTTMFSNLGGLAFAYWLIFRARRRNVWFALVASSLIASYIVRVYAWRALLGSGGAAAHLFAAVGLVPKGQPVLLFTLPAVVLAQTQVFLPLCALTIAAGLLRVDPALVEQSRMLGYARSATLIFVTLPLVGRAIFASLCFTFFLASGDYLTPLLLGGAGTVTFGSLIVNQFQGSGSFAMGGAFSLAMVAAFVIWTILARFIMRRLGLLPRT